MNWDPVDKTVLADEEIVGGRAERSGALVEKRWIPQWFFKITEYAQRLIDDLDKVDWPEGIKQQQRNWIGRSEGVRFTVNVAAFEAKSVQEEDGNLVVVDKERRLNFECFTTRIDTIFGVTFFVLAPEHPLIDTLMKMVGDPHASEVRAYREQAKLLSDIDRQAETREKTGVFTGAYAVNPANGEKCPIWIADYVLVTYGTGAIMAVPGHDTRDFEFATKFGIPIVQVISPDGGPAELPFDAKEGVLVNSGSYNGRGVVDAQAALGEWVEGHGIGERVVQYRLRDWLISRQRYWGCPIPVIHCQTCGVVPVPDSGNCAALGYSLESGIPFEMAFVRNHYVGRSFLQPSQLIRDFDVRVKLNLIGDLVKGKRVIIVDDSIVRGTTCKTRVNSLKEAGAKEVHVLVSCPPHMHPCVYGIDFPDRNKLMAANHSIDEIRKYLNADSLHYLSQDGMVKATGLPRSGFCMACYDGDYPVAYDPKLEKNIMERRRARQEAYNAAHGITPATVVRSSKPTSSTVAPTSKVRSAHGTV
mgnify:CR=1 FL=1